MEHNIATTFGALRRLIAAVAAAITDHHSFLLASGVAFTAALGLVPALISIIATYGLLASPADVETQVTDLTQALPEPARELIVSELGALTTTDATTITIGLIIGLAGSAYALSSVLNAIVMAVRVAHDRPSPHTWLQGRLFALRLSAVAVISIAAGIWFIVALPPVLDHANLTSELATLISVVRWPAAIVVSSLAVGLLYRAVVGQRGRILGISPGALTATGIWVFSTWGLGLAYEHIGRLQSTFTTFGAVAALLIWLYLSAVAVVIGAEVDHVIDTGAAASRP